MHTRKKQLWAMMAAMNLVGACLISTAAAEMNTTTAASNTTTAAGGGMVSAATMPALAGGRTQVGNKVAAPFVTMAGSEENAIALATALRTGTTANLTFTSTSPTGKAAQTTTEVAIPTKPMGWGNVSHALALTQFSLRQAGIENPTAAELQAALDGGTITTAGGKSLTLAGVLQQRADGMGWGRIAKTYGTTMGAVNRGLKAPATTVASPTPTPTRSTAATQRPVVAGATQGRGGSGVMTASSGTGTNNMAARSSRGLTTGTGATSNAVTTASGATAGGSSGVVAGNGQGNAFGRGVVTGAGGAASNVGIGARGGVSGVVTGSGATATRLTTADSGGGGGKANGHGNGHGKGGG